MPGDNNILHKGMVPAPLALELVLAGASSVGTQEIDLAQANGRILSEDLISKRTQPPFSASAMDGYAVRHNDLGHSETTLTLVGEAAAGHPYQGQVGKAECIRIFTGASVPNDTDTIIIQEDTSSRGDQITILENASMGKFVRPAGLDFQTGDCLLTKGTMLDPQSLSLCASMDYPSLIVCAKPKVAVLATGDELVFPGQSTNPGQIIASNTFGVSAIAESAGAQVTNLGIALDTLDDLKSKIDKALGDGADLIVTSGGASVGDHDLVKPVMESFGFRFSFVKIAMRPGKPVIFGQATIDGKERRFLGLAGNPVSSLVSSHIFLKPLIRLLGGYPADMAKPVQATLRVGLFANDEREDYVRGKASRGADGELIVEPFERQDSSMLATLSKADCLIIRPINAHAAKAGDTTRVIMLRDV